MKKRDDYLIEWLQKQEGKLIGIGLEEKFFSVIEKNDKIVSCELLNSTILGKEKGKKEKQKVIPARRLRKKFKKKKHDIMLISYPHISHYIKTFIRDSIYITKKELCFYNLQEEEKELLKRRYKRYKTMIKEVKVKDDTILFVDTTKAKNHKLLDFFYFIFDTLLNGIDLFSDLLVN